MRPTPTSEELNGIPTQPFPSCLNIDQTIDYLNRADFQLSHAPEGQDVDRARVLIEEAIADVDAYREIHSGMRAWGQAWKEAYLSKAGVYETP